MLSFANPAALWALLGLLVPLAIHLWNRRPGRVVPVGALRWLTAGANRRMRQLHLTQWPLLLLRLLLVAALALVAAAPRWYLPPPPTRPQVLIAPEVPASPAWSLLRPTIDSLRRRGAVVRTFGPGFPRWADSLGQLVVPAARPGVAGAAVSSAMTLGGPDAYWSRAAEAVDSFPAGPLYLFTGASLAHFGGSRPALPARLRWQLVPPDSGRTAWLAAAARPAPDSLRLTIAQGDANGVTLRQVHRSWPRPLSTPINVPGLPPLRLHRQGTGYELRPVLSETAPATGGAVGAEAAANVGAAASQAADAAAAAAESPKTTAGNYTADAADADRANAVPVTAPLRVGIGYDDSRRTDLRYLRAALLAAAPALPAGLRLRTAPAAAPAPLAADSLDWLLWLSDQPLPAAFARRVPAGLRVLTDAPGPGQPAPADFSFADAPDATSRLLRRGGRGPAGGSVQWADASGQPVLTSQRRGQGAVYQFYSRFQPQWSRLPDDGQLPALLLALLQPPPSILPGADPRRLPLNQLTSLRTAPPGPRVAARAPHHDLRPWLALAAGLLFGAERLLAARRMSLALPATA